MGMRKRPRRVSTIMTSFLSKAGPCQRHHYTPWHHFLITTRKDRCFFVSETDIPDLIFPKNRGLFEHLKIQLLWSSSLQKTRLLFLFLSTMLTEIRLRVDVHDGRQEVWKGFPGSGFSQANEVSSLESHGPPLCLYRGGLLEPCFHDLVQHIVCRAQTAMM